MNYFTCAQTKAVLNNNDAISHDDSRPDLLRDRYQLERKHIMTPKVELQIERLYCKWCDLLFSCFNVVVNGPNSKFALLETFKRSFLDSGRLLDAQSGDPLKPLNITTVRMHGLDPVKMEAFNHSIFDIKETRRAKEADFQAFGQVMKKEKMHYVFMIHSCEYFIENCEEVFEAICKLYTMYPHTVHIIMSSDHWNGGLKMENFQHTLQLIFTRTPLIGVDSFLWEKTELLGDFDPADARANDTTMHRLFADKTDLQSLKDIYQALDSATQQILAYIIKDVIDKTESNDVVAAAATKKRFEAFDAEDDDERPMKDEDKADKAAPMRLRRSNYNTSATTTERRQTASNRRSQAQKLMSTHLDFQHLLKYCESKFIVRRGAALRDHLGELKDHKLIATEEAGNRIQCLVDLHIGKKFLSWISDAAAA